MLDGDLVVSEFSVLMEGVQQLLSVTSSTFTTDLSILAVEVLGDFLKRSVSGFDEEEVDNDQLKSQPAVVHNVVLPGDVLDGDWVDVVVEEESAVDEEEHDSETLGTNLEWENLDGVADEETRPGQVVAGIVQVDHSDDGTTSSGVVGGLTTFGADRPCDEADQHTTGGGKEERATSEAVNHESHSTSDKHVPDLQATVDQVLINLIGDTDLLENERDVVRDERVTGPLGEETSAQADEHPVSVTLGGEKNGDVLLVEFPFKSEGLLDFDEFVADEVVIEVAVGVVLGKDGESLLVAVDGDQPTWGFWDEPDEADHDKSWGGLKDGWSSPGPFRLNLESSESSPGGNDGTEIPGGVVDRSDLGAVLHVAQFGDEEWGGAVGEGDTETDQETSTDEHTEILGGGLESDTDEHDEETNHDGDSSASPIGQPWGEWNGHDGTDGHNGVEETQLR